MQTASEDTPTGIDEGAGAVVKAAVYTRYGPPDVLQLKEVEKPTPKDNEVLIEVHATTVNRTDCGFLRAEPFFLRLFSGLTRPRKTILGNEFAGRIEAIGKHVTSFHVGDRVFGYTDFGLGAHAEYMTMPEAGMLTTIPADMTCEEIAPGTEGSHYALNNIRKADVRKGQNVLIYGATGAIGSAAVQLSKYYGASITAVCATKNLPLAESLGADDVIDYTAEDFTRTGRTYDFVFDAVGKSSFGRCKRLLRPGGIYCSTDLGRFAQNPFLVIWTSVFGSKKVIAPIPKATKKDAEFLKARIEDGTFKPVIDRTYPLDQIVEAFRYVEQGQKTGNVVITVKR